MQLPNTTVVARPVGQRQRWQWLLQVVAANAEGWFYRRSTELTLVVDLAESTAPRSRTPDRGQRLHMEGHYASVPPPQLQGTTIAPNDIMQPHRPIQDAYKGKSSAVSSSFPRTSRFNPHYLHLNHNVFQPIQRSNWCVSSSSMIC